MKTYSDYATNAACPQRPTWQISPVDYKWAQAIFGDCKQRQICNITKGVETLPRLDKILGKIVSRSKQAMLISRRQTGKLSWMSWFAANEKLP